MPAHLTAAEAKALGVDVKAARPRSTRRTAAGPYRSRCHDCGETFSTRASETRHVAPGHCRFDTLDVVTIAVRLDEHRVCG